MYAIPWYVRLGIDITIFAVPIWALASFYLNYHKVILV